MTVSLNLRWEIILHYPGRPSGATGDERSERGDDVKTEGTEVVWPGSRESKAASRSWRRQGRDAPERTSSADLFTLAW